MTTIKTATIRTEQTRLIVTMPFDADAKEALKAAIPHADRTPVYQPTFYWSIAPAYLDTVRALVAEYAAANDWRVEDYTLRSAADIAAERATEAAAARAQHIAAFLAVLPHLPARSLALVAYHEQRRAWELELREHLAEELFRAVLAASLRGNRETMLFSGDHKRSWGFKIEIAADERLLRALVERRDVAHIQVYRDLTVTHSFDDGAIVHLVDASGTVLVGGRWDTAALGTWNFASAAWPLAALDAGIYVVFKRETYICDLLNESATGWAGFGGSFAVAMTKRSAVVQAAEGLHIEAWLRAWAHDLVAQPHVTHDRWRHGKGRISSDYVHPADTLLDHFRRFGAPDLAALLGWSAEDIAQHRAAIAQIKADAATAYVADERARAPELARPKLDEMKKADLLALAEKHGIAVKKSMKNPELVATILSNQATCEAVIGLSPYAEATASI